MRWFDIVRLQMLPQIIAARSPVENPINNSNPLSTRYLAPIPISDLTLDPNWTQNAGYDFQAHRSRLGPLTIKNAMMKYKKFLLAILVVSVSYADGFAQSADVDPTIGNVGMLLEPTRPTANLPNEPIRVYPIRKDYLDDQITCFPLTAVSHRLGEVFALRPVVGPVAPASWDVRMPYDHDLEVTRPWYYSTFLLQDGITVEFAPGRLTGDYRFSFPAGSTPSLLLDLFNDGEGYWHFPSATTLEGMETWQGGVKVYMGY